MNPILSQCIESRNGNYCHVLEVSDVYELECAIESISGEGWSTEDLKEFFNTMTVYAMNEANEDEIYNFNFENYIDSLI